MLNAKSDCAFRLNSLPFTIEKVKQVSCFGSLSLVANLACFVAPQYSKKYDQVLEFLNGVCIGGNLAEKSS